ncbi:adhesion G protein-coupled receptor L2-like [Ptychodera flava]|uniref:adhesion G protein-coupled receptor L2-like n=1 Tax=Ptychodera flava TaxID=63121 RepID=UPI00396A8A8A
MVVFRLLRFLFVGVISSTILCNVSGNSSCWNFAFLKSATQSSVKLNAIASRAVDGNRDSNFQHGSCTHTKQESEPWWKVDLAVEYTIHTVVVTNRNYKAQRLQGAVIRVGNSDVIANNEQCGETITADEISSNEMIEVECCLEGRFVSVQLESTNHGVLTLCEVEVLGEATSLYECEDSEANLACATGTIHVLSANYGRTRSDVCHNLGTSNMGYYANTDCIGASSHSTVSEECDGTASCSVSVKNTIFGDPCGGIVKYLNVSYTCLSDRSNCPDACKTASTTVESTTNEATTQEISTTTVEIITTKFPSSGATTEETLSPTLGRSPTRVSTSEEHTTNQGTASPKTTMDISTKEHTTLSQLTQLCTKRIGKHIISINSESSLMAVGRAGFRSNSSRPLLTCSDGIWSPGFPRYTNIDECAEDKNVCSPRSTNQECIDNIGSYRCVCKQGFVSLESKLCAPLFLIEKECRSDAFSTYKTCPAGPDTLTNIHWESLPANCNSDWVNCPDGYTGKMIRFCDERGEWWEPYTTECKSEEILDMIDQVPDLSISSSTAGLLTNITLSMDTAYAGNLLLAKYTISDVLENDPLSSAGSEDDKMTYLQSIVNLVSALLDADTEPSWIQIHETRGVHLGAIALFDTLNRFGETVHRYVRQANIDVKLPSKNIGFEAKQVKSNGDDLDFPSKVKFARHKRSQESVWYKVDERGSKVVIPRENVIENSDGLTVIVFTYKNPANILPPGVQKGTDRQWVRTITATKKVERVNSPVISVSIYKSEDGKYVRKLQEPLTFTLYHKEAGYNAKCISMIYGNPTAIWNYENCQKVNHNATSYFTECQCDHVGSVAIITTMGKMPTPFVVYALRRIILVANGLAAFLTSFTFVMLCLRRITTDHYFVCTSLTLSLTLYFFVVVTALNMDRGTMSCRVTAMLHHYTLISSCAWVFNFCLQHFLKLRFGLHKRIHARVFYVGFGWIIPLMLVLSFALKWPRSYDLTQSCRVPYEIGLFVCNVAPAAIITLLCWILTMYIYCKFDYLVFTYGSGPWYILWDEFFRIVLLLPSFSVALVSGLQDISGNLFFGYTFAVASFFVGSVCYLGYFATNKVVLRSIRARFYGTDNDDPDEISFSSYSSDEDDGCVVSFTVTRERQKSETAIPGQSIPPSIELHDISMPGSSGHVVRDMEDELGENVDASDIRS